METGRSTMEDFNMMFLNIRSLSKKLDELELQIQGRNVDAILLCEHWLTESAMDSCKLPQYNLSGYFCRSQSGGGGTLIYTKSNYVTKKIMHLNNLSIDKHCEITGVEVINVNIVIVCIYRSPSGQLDLFFQTLDKILELLNQKNKKIFIYGDFNIDLLLTDQATLEFSQLLNSYGLKYLVNKPTRISKISKSSCLDNCITNASIEANWSLWDTYMSDHMAITNTYRYKKKTLLITAHP